MNYLCNQIWTRIVDQLTLKQLGATMGHPKYRTKAEIVKRVSKSKSIHAMADQLIELCDLLDMADELNVSIVYNRHGLERLRMGVGIHLTNPSLYEISDALNVAARYLYPAIYIHS